MGRQFSYFIARTKEMADMKSSERRTIRLMSPDSLISVGNRFRNKGRKDAGYVVDANCVVGAMSNGGCRDSKLDKERWKQLQIHIIGRGKIIENTNNKVQYIYLGRGAKGNRTKIVINGDIGIYGTQQ